MKRIKRWVMGLLMAGGKLVLPILRWAGEGNPAIVKVDTPAGPHVSSEGSPISQFSLDSARLEMAQLPTLQRDLNSALECMRLEAFSHPFMRMYASLLMHYPFEETFYRVVANAVVLGFVAGQMSPERLERRATPTVGP